MELNKLDLSRYNDEQLKVFINRSWDIISLLAHGYKERPIGMANIDFIAMLDDYMIQAANILFERERHN